MAVRVFIACSLDGFIASEGDGLDWLSGHQPAEGFDEDPEALSFEGFMAGVGAILMGRRTYDVIAAFDGWAYGETPVLIPTHRPLEAERSTVRAVSGIVEELVEEAKRVAGDKDVYVDGGQLIRSAWDAGLIDDFVITVVPMVLGAGVPLFAGARQQKVTFHQTLRGPQGMVQLHGRPLRS